MSICEAFLFTRIDTQHKAVSQSTILWVLGGSTVAVFSNMYATQPILPIIGEEFGLKPSEAGMTVSALVLAVGCSAVFFGFLIDRFGPRRVMVASTLALVFPTLMCAVSPFFQFLLLSRVAQGLLIPGFIAGVLAYIHEEFSSRRGMAIGWYTASTIFGGFSGRVIGGLLTEFVNWRTAFVGFALFNLVAYLIMRRYLPESHHSSRNATNRSKGHSLNSFIIAFKNRNLVGAFLVGPAIFFPFIGLFTYLPYYLTKPPFNLSTLLVSFIFVVYLIGTFSAPIAGRLSDRYSRRAVIGIGLLIMMFGIALTLTPWLLSVFAGLLFLCFGMFTVQSTTNAYVGDNIQENQGRGSAVALYQMFFYLGGTIGGIVPGLLWQSGGWLPLICGCLAALVAGFLAVVWVCR
ncbi:MFS transporter [Candidatus Chlorohelix sp.]|uniref:MFS transporter n=1 Tax=Candidatus Chlorohelix sp. TaxID=3139201 RepID=UPI003057006C